MNNIELLNEIFNTYLVNLLESDNIIQTNNHISPSTNSKWGDYQTNIAMKFFKKTNAKNPKDFGNQIIRDINKVKDGIDINKVKDGIDINKVKDGIDINKVKDGIDINKVKDGIDINKVKYGIDINKVKDGIDINKDFQNKNFNNLIEELNIAGPGFINIKLKDKYLMELIDEIVENEEPILSDNYKKQKIVIDYSSPNIAKEMHVGHLRSTIIGDVLGNILEYRKHTVIRINHVGDWGTQFGMLIAYLEKMEYKLNENLTISDLHIWYKESKKMFDFDVEFNKLAHKRVVELQSGDEECLKKWKKICEISSYAYQNIYKRLNISKELKECGESFYNNFLPKIVEELENKHLINNKDNAKIMFVKKNKPPLIIKKGDGGYGYDTTDMAALKYRINKLKADKIVYVTDSGQSLHFELLFEAGKKAGWLNNTKLEYIPFGIVLGDDGKKIKSRSGQTIKLTDVLDQSYKTFLEENIKRKLELNEPNKSSKCLIDDDVMIKCAQIIGWSAIKYADLRQNRINNYQFNYKKMLDYTGDTIVYQFYAWVRIKNLFRKTNVKLTEIKESKYILDKTNLTSYNTERELVLHLTQFDEVLKKVENTLYPNYLCEYMYKLSGKFNNFWRDCKVLDKSHGIELERSRLKICFATQVIMRSCFNILSIPADEIDKL